jgi:D-arabinitol dehydrogenase (NADP+)
LANICVREFIAKFPLIPGHETVGVVAAMGKDVKGFELGDRVVADNSEVLKHSLFTEMIG